MVSQHGQKDLLRLNTTHQSILAGVWHFELLTLNGIACIYRLFVTMA